MIVIPLCYGMWAYWFIRYQWVVHSDMHYLEACIANPHPSGNGGGLGSHQNPGTFPVAVLRIIHLGFRQRGNPHGYHHKRLALQSAYLDTGFW